VTNAEFRRITLAQDTRAQVDALNRIEVQPGEVYLVPARTPHAIGSGVFVVEVQEPGVFVVNAEYVTGEIRRTETQRFMGLGFELGMRCFDYRAAGTEFVRRNRRVARPLFESAEGWEERLIGPEDTPCFGAARLSVRGRVADHDRGRCYSGAAPTGTSSAQSGSRGSCPGGLRRFGFGRGGGGLPELLLPLPPAGEQGRELFGLLGIQEGLNPGLALETDLAEARPDLLAERGELLSGVPQDALHLLLLVGAEA
jgi:hypothetical protein